MIDLQKERINKGLTQEQLAEKVGVVRQTISEIECGRKKPSVQLAIKLGKVLKIKWTNFFEK